MFTCKSEEKVSPHCEIYIYTLVIVRTKVVIVRNKVAIIFSIIFAERMWSFIARVWGSRACYPRSHWHCCELARLPLSTCWCTTQTRWRSRLKESPSHTYVTQGSRKSTHTDLDIEEFSFQKEMSFRVNVDVQSHAVCPVGVLSSTVNPEKLPSSRDFIINITEVRTNTSAFFFCCFRKLLKAYRKMWHNYDPFLVNLFEQHCRLLMCMIFFV